MKSSVAQDTTQPQKRRDESVLYECESVGYARQRGQLVAASEVLESPNIASRVTVTHKNNVVKHFSVNNVTSEYVVKNFSAVDLDNRISQGMNPSFLYEIKSTDKPIAMIQLMLNNPKPPNRKIHTPKQMPK